MSTWTLDFFEPDGMGWQTIAEKPSADGCKSEARRWYEVNAGRAFRIYDGLGRLVFYSVPNNGCRLRWKWGDFSQRSTE